MNILPVLQAAILNRIELDVIYDGGSRPGLPRRILPLGIRGDILRARANGQTKSFKLELLRMRDDFPDHLYRRYASIQDLIRMEKHLILDTGLIPHVGRRHIILTDKRRTCELSLCHRENRWICCGKEYPGFQQAAEAFMVELLSFNLHKHALPSNNQQAV